MRTQLHLNGTVELPPTIMLDTPIEEVRGRSNATQGGKAVYEPADLPEHCYEYVLSQSIGDTDLNDWYEAGQRISLKVVFINETRNKNKITVGELKEYTLADLLPVRLVTDTTQNKVFLTVVTMTPPKRNPEVRPALAAAG
jgi:hypothetical protein